MSEALEVHGKDLKAGHKVMMESGATKTVKSVGKGIVKYLDGGRAILITYDDGGWSHVRSDETIKVKP